jgi:hypothetical protein
VAGAVGAVDPKDMVEVDGWPEVLPNWKGEFAGLSCEAVVVGAVPKRLLAGGAVVSVAPKELGEGADVVGAPKRPPVEGAVVVLPKRLEEGADVVGPPKRPGEGTAALTVLNRLLSGTALVVVGALPKTLLVGEAVAGVEPNVMLELNGCPASALNKNGELGGRF